MFSRHTRPRGPVLKTWRPLHKKRIQLETGCSGVGGVLPGRSTPRVSAPENLYCQALWRWQCCLLLQRSGGGAVVPQPMRHPASFIQSLLEVSIAVSLHLICWLNQPHTSPTSTEAPLSAAASRTAARASSPVSLLATRSSSAGSCAKRDSAAEGECGCAA